VTLRERITSIMTLNYIFMAPTTLAVIFYKMGHKDSRFKEPAKQHSNLGSVKIVSGEPKGFITQIDESLTKQNDASDRTVNSSGLYPWSKEHDY